ncbi:MAG: hypothetical protein PVSMB7_30000 [Chloroflexota bacterium]
MDSQTHTAGGGMIESQDLLAMLAAANRFDLSALATNEAGRLTETQARAIGSQNRKSNRILPLVGVALLAVGLLELVSRGLSSGTALFLIGFGLLLLIVFFVWGRTQSDAVFKDEPVEVLEGLVRRKMQSTTSTNAISTIYFYVLQGREFRVQKTGYDALDEGVRYRVYYVSRLDAIVNIVPVTAMVHDASATVRRNRAGKSELDKG